MLLISYVVLSAVGFSFFALGTVFQYYGVASIGAVLLIAVGGAVAIGGLEVAVGEDVDRDYETVEVIENDTSTSNKTISNETVVTNVSRTTEYREVAILEQFDSATTTLGLGALHLLLGGIMFSRQLEEIT